MKRLLSLLCCMAILLSSLTMVSFADESALADQQGVIGSYRDSTLTLSQPDVGYVAGAEIYPSPDYSRVANPASYTFLLINLKHYSGQVHPERGDVALDENFYYSVRTSFENARKNGAMLGIRFRFDDVGKTNTEPDWENMIGMFEDIRESGILEEYKDIIVWCEMGTLGAFGEQWGTRYGSFAYSDELIDVYLNMIPDQIPILLRTTGRITSWVNSKLGTKYNSSTIQNMVDEVNTTYADFVNDAPKYTYEGGKKTEGAYYSGDGEDFSTGNLLKDDLARLGLYNDGYMGTNWDYGTFSNRETETAFLNDQTNVVYGGEYSGDRYLSMYYGGPTNVWWPINGIPEMYYTNLSYLHSGIWSDSNQSRTNKESNADEVTAAKLASRYNSIMTDKARFEEIYKELDREDLIDKLTVEEVKAANSAGDEVVVGYKLNYVSVGYNNLPMTEEIEKAVEAKIGVELDLSDYYGISTQQYIRDHMGYRFIVRDSDMTGGSVEPGEELQIKLQVENTGFHRIIAQRDVELILENGGRTMVMPIEGVDVRDWDTGMHAFETAVTLPEGITGGVWKVYLRISVPNDDPNYDHKYAVKFANAEIFNLELGANLIGEITVSGDAVSGETYTENRPAGMYYEDPKTYPADEEELNFLENSYYFTTDNKYGYTILFKVDGIAEGSEINLTRWVTTGTSASGYQLHSFNYFFKNSKYGYGKTLTENGYYMMYCPFHSVGSGSGPSVAGNHHVGSFKVNAGTSREDKNTLTSLNGNQATITPLGIMEGAPSSYDVTFHYDGKEWNYQGEYAFRNTDRNVTESCQFKLGVTVLDLYEGEQPTDKRVDGIPYRFVGWTTAEGYAAGLVDENYLASGTLDLYPYYEPDLSGYTSAIVTETLDENNRGKHHVRYTLDETTMTATVGELDSVWSGTAGFDGVGTNALEIPAFVIKDGVYYRVISIAPKAFASQEGLRNIWIPSTVTQIAQDAFYGVTDTVKIHTYADTPAAVYAQEQGMECESVSERSVFGLIFLDEDGTVLEMNAANAGEDPYYTGTDPKSEDGRPFVGWSIPMDTKVTSDLIFVAQYGTLLDKYADLERGKWYSDAVLYALETGMMNGVDDTRFSPNGETTRGMFVTVLWRLEGEPEVASQNNPFEDVADGKYYEKAVLWAYSGGVVNGISQTAFKPGNPLTREQFATIIYRYAKEIKGQDVTVENGSLSAYTDADQVGSYATEAMIWANTKGYITGTSATTLSPKNKTTRAQMATILYRYISDQSEQ